MELLFYVLCTTLAIHIIAFAQFWDFPWRSKKAAAVLAALNICFKLLLVHYFEAQGINIAFAELLLCPTGLLVYCWALRVDPFKLLFSFILSMDYLMIIRGLASACAVLLFSAGAYSWLGSLLCIALFLLTLPEMLWFLRHPLRPLYEIDAPEIWRVIWIIPALSTGIVFVFTAGLQEETVGQWRFLFARVSLLACVLAICWVLLQALERMHRLAAREQQLAFETHLLDIQMEEQEKYSALLLENAAQLRRQRHDLRHQLTVIRGLAESGGEALLAYLDPLLKAIPQEPASYCENPAVNAIVSHYAALCRQSGIELQVKLAVPANNAQVTDGSLCVIFGNLLENAVEACGRMTEGQRFIQLHSSLQYGTLTITMDNSFESCIQENNGTFLSAKRKGPGIGLSSVQQAARQAHGDARFAYDGPLFRSCVYVQV